MGRSKLAGVIAGILVLSACGGGGSSSGGGAPTGGGGTPTPSPSPSPTPSPTYSTYAELTGNQTFALTCAGLERDSFQAFSSIPIPFGMDTQTLSYDASADTWTVSGEVSQTFGPADAVTSTNPLVENYYRIDQTGAPPKTLLIAAPEPGGSKLQYARSMFYQLPNTALGTTQNRNCVFGVPSDPNDRPSASTVSYTAFDLAGTITRQFDDNSVASYSLSGSNISVSVNMNTYSVSIAMDVTGTLANSSGSGLAASAPNTIDLGTLTATDVGINDEPYGIGGLFNYEDVDKNIPFEGWFFGPQGKEIGFAITYSSNDPDITNRTWGTIGNMTLTASR